MHEFTDLDPDQQRQVRRAAESRGMTPRELMRHLRASQAARLAVLDNHNPADELEPDYYAVASNAGDDGFSVRAKRG